VTRWEPEVRSTLQDVYVPIVSLESGHCELAETAAGGLSISENRNLNAQAKDLGDIKSVYSQSWYRE
jgi:hypothetical protein